MNENQPPTLLCVGYGYSARVLAERLAAQGWRIAATARSEDKADALRQRGVDAHIWPADALFTALPRRTHLLLSASPEETGDPVLAHHRAALLAQRERIDWIGYLSTTSVYGDHQGGAVDETTPMAPSSNRGQRRVQAEQDWLALVEDGLPVHTFRLAGIYGAGRGPFEKLRNGKSQRIIKDGQVFGRIHVEDIATVLHASITRPNPGGVYNVTDDLTCPPQDVIAHAADLLGIACPPAVPFEDANLSPMARSFYSESKRVLNTRIKDELGVTLAYPTYREGLAAILAEEG